MIEQLEDSQHGPVSPEQAYVANPVAVTLPDGSRREFPHPVTGAELAATIGPGLAKAAIAIRVDGRPRDLTSVIDRDASVAVITRDTPEVVECHRMTGEDCYFIKAHVRSVEHLEEVIDRFTPYGQTTTSIVQSSPVPRRGVEL